MTDIENNPSDATRRELEQQRADAAARLAELLAKGEALISNARLTLAELDQALAAQLPDDKPTED